MCAAHITVVNDVNEAERTAIPAGKFPAPQRFIYW